MILLLLLLCPRRCCQWSVCRPDAAVMETVNLFAAVVTFVLAVRLAGLILSSGTVASMDNLLYADALSALVVLLISFVYLACAVYAIGYFRHDKQNEVFDEDFIGSVIIGKLRKILRADSAVRVLDVSGSGFQITSACCGLRLKEPRWPRFSWSPSTGVRLLLKPHGSTPSSGGVGLSMALFGTVLTYYAAHRSSEERLWHAELVGAGREAPAVRQARYAAGVHSGAAGLRNQGRSGAHAHMEARRLRRSAGSRGSDVARRVLNCAIYGAGPVLHVDHPFAGTGICLATADRVRPALDRESRFRSFWCSGATAACWRTRASTTAASWCWVSVLAALWERWACSFT